MQNQATTSAADGGIPPRAGSAAWRTASREATLRNALRKRISGVPTYTVPEAAALLSVSHEHLYRLIRASEFPAVRMGRGREQGRYVVPAKAVERLLDAAVPAEPIAPSGGDAA